MTTSDSRFPIILDLRDPGSYQEIRETLVVYNNKAQTKELPDEFQKVTITGYSEIEEGQTLSANQYIVDYDTGIITFGGTIANGTSVTATYYGRGNQMYPANRIYIVTDQEMNYANLQSIFDSATNGSVITVNGKSGAVTLTASDVSALPLSGGTLTGNLIINGGGVQPTVSGKNATTPLSSYPNGISVQYLSTETGFPTNEGTVVTVNGGISRNYQMFHAKNTTDIYVRTWDDTTSAWTAWSKLLDENSLSMGIGSGFDADKLDGKHASYFEDLINNHISNTSNPHNTVASQIPIADTTNVFNATNVEDALVELKGHEVQGNPHNTQASQIPIADTAGNFTSTNVEGALAEEAAARKAHEARTDNPHNVTASQVPIEDAGGKFTSTNVEGALAELHTIVASSTGEPNTYDVKAYGAKGDGVTDDTSAIQEAIDTANSNGGGIVYIPAGTYKVSSPIVMKSNVHIKGAGTDVTIVEGTAIDANAALDKKPIFQSAVPSTTILTQTNDVKIGDTSNTISNSAKAGDFIVYSTNKRFTEEWDGGTAIRTYWTNGELFKIKSATSTSVSFTEGASLSMPVANKVQVETFTPTKNVGISDLTVTRTGDTTSNSVGVWIQYTDKALVQNVRSEKSNWGGIIVDRSMNVEVHNCEVIGGTIDLGLNYGVLISDGAKHVYVRNIRTRNCRHGFSSGGSAIPNKTTGYAIPMKVIADGLFISETQQPTNFPAYQNHSLDCHSNSMNFIINNCDVDWGLGIGGIGHKVKNVLSVDGVFSTFDGGTDMSFEQIRFTRATKFSSTSPIKRTRFIDVEIHLTNWIYNAIDSGSSDLVFDRFKIINEDIASATTNAQLDATIPSASYQYGLRMYTNFTLINSVIKGFPIGFFVDGMNCHIDNVLVQNCGWDSALTADECVFKLSKNATGTRINDIKVENTLSGFTFNNAYVFKLTTEGTGSAKLIGITNVTMSARHTTDYYYGVSVGDGYSEVFMMNCRITAGGGGNTWPTGGQFPGKSLYNSFHADT